MTFPALVCVHPSSTSSTNSFSHVKVVIIMTIKDQTRDIMKILAVVIQKVLRWAVPSLFHHGF